MYYAPETLPRAQALLSASADIEVRYELALERADRWPGRPEVKARRISRLVVSRDHERAVIREQIERLQRECFFGGPARSTLDELIPHDGERQIPFRKDLRLSWARKP